MGSKLNFLEPPLFTRMHQLSEYNKQSEQVHWEVIPDDELPWWVTPVLAGTWFVGLFVIFWMYQTTDISLVEILKWFVLFAVVLTLIPYKWVLKFIKIEYSQLLAINFIGLGPFLTSLFLIFNSLFAPLSTTTTYGVNSFVLSDSGFENDYLFVVLEGDSLKDQPKLRRFEYSHFKIVVQESDSLELTIKKGLFGYDVRDGFRFY